MTAEKHLIDLLMMSPQREQLWQRVVMTVRNCQRNDLRYPENADLYNGVSLDWPRAQATNDVIPSVWSTSTRSNNTNKVNIYVGQQNFYDLYQLG